MAAAASESGDVDIQQLFPEADFQHGDRVIYDGREGIVSLELGGSIADNSDAESDATDSDRNAYIHINFDDGTEVHFENEVDGIQAAPAQAEAPAGMRIHLLKILENF